MALPMSVLSNDDSQASCSIPPLIPFTPLVIIGAGFSGLCLSVQLLRQLNFTEFHIYERNPTVGGTWFSNRFPGCACDVPALLYSLSFERNPGWSRAYPGQKEIEEYLNGIVNKYGLKKHITFSTTFVSATWDDGKGLWTIELEEHVGRGRGKRFKHLCKVLVTATGLLSEPSDAGVKSLPGYQNFINSGGKIIHTALWPSDLSPSSPDLGGKDIVVVGNGATAAQLIPALLPFAKRITQVFRSPQWYVPQLSNGSWSPSIQFVFQNFPLLSLVLRYAFFWLGECDWPIFYSNNPISNTSRHLKSLKIQKSMKKTIPPAYHSILIPKYSLGCKRQIRGNAYLASLSNPNLRLINYPITSLGTGTITIGSGSAETKVSSRLLILATGFETGKFITHSCTITNHIGLNLAESWTSVSKETKSTSFRPTSYLSLSTTNFPNLFFVLGPNSGQGHTSVLVMIENQVNYLLHLLRPLLLRSATPNIKSIMLSPSAETKYTEKIQGALKRRVWQTGGCTSFYKRSSDGYNAMTCPWSQSWMWWKLVGEVWMAEKVFGKWIGGWERDVWHVKYQYEHGTDIRDVEDIQKEKGILYIPAVVERINGNRFVIAALGLVAMLVLCSIGFKFSAWK